MYQPCYSWESSSPVMEGVGRIGISTEEGFARLLNHDASG